MLQKETLFELPSFEQLRTIKNKPHQWLQTYVSISKFQNQLSQNLTLITATKEQNQTVCFVFRQFFRHRHQLIRDNRY